MREIPGGTDLVPVQVRLQVKDGNGTWQDISHRLISASWEDSIDYDSPSFDFKLDNNFWDWIRPGNQSLDPADPNSSYYVNGEPLLGCKHEVKFELSKDNGSTWHELFRGYVGPGGVESSVSFEGDDVIDVKAVGLDYNLKSYYFTEDLAYEDAYATSIANQILKDHGFSYTITVIDEPNYMVTFYRTKDTSLWDAISKLFTESGYVFRVKWYDGAFRFCVYDPKRTDDIVDPMITFTGDFSARDLKVNEEDVRTKVIVEYRDRNTGAVKYESAEDDEARQHYGAYDGAGGRKHVIMRYSTKDHSLIDTAGEAAELAALILHDLKKPTPDVEIEIPFLVPIFELHDTVRFIGQDYAVDLGVTGVSWDWSATNPYGSTTITGTAKRVIGLARDWLVNDPHSPDAAESQGLISVTGDGRRPDTPTDVRVFAETVQDQSGKTVPIVYVTWAPVENWDLDHYEVWTRLRDQDGMVIQDWKLQGVTRKEAYEIRGLPSGKLLDVQIYAVDWEWTTAEGSE